jgi:pimeloyl-ACP methyl ester carboxylesterase
VACLAIGLVFLGSGLATQAQDDDEKPAEPEAVTLPTKDGVELHATYYAGNQGKKTVPIIMLHMHRGRRADYDSLAKRLQAKGHAVIVPDLRGHGASTTAKDATRPLNADRLSPNDYAQMVVRDVETVKRFLLEKHNQGLLNIEQLCVIGAEMGATVAMNWTALDWSWPVLATGKQGQDVKALVLLSPVRTFKGLKATEAVERRGLRGDVAVYVIVGGESSRERREADRLVSQLERYHTDPNANDDPQSRMIFYDQFDTSLQGTKMLGENIKRGDMTIEERIELFIKLKLVDKDYPWKDRTGPLN